MAQRTAPPPTTTDRRFERVGGPVRPGGAARPRPLERTGATVRGGGWRESY